MANGEERWTSRDSLQCWNALAALWSEKEFTNCIRLEESLPEGRGDAMVESILLNWNGSTWEFSPWVDVSPHGRETRSHGK